MKKYFLFIFLFLVASSGKTQDADLSANVKWGELFKLGKKSVAPTVIGQDGQHIYIIRTIKKKQFIEKYKTSSLTLERSLLLDLSYNKKKLTLIDQFIFGEKPALYTNFYNKKTKKSYFFVQTINTKTLTISKPQKVSEKAIEPRNKLSLFNGLYNSIAALGGSTMFRSKSGELGFFMSNDINLNKKKGEVSNEPTLYTGALYDVDFKMLSEIEFKLPYDKFTIMQRRLSEDGLLYILGYEYDEEETKKLIGSRTTISRGAMHMLILDTESGEFETIDIDTEEMTIEMMMFDLLYEGGFQVVGLSSSQGSGVSGGFAITFNESFEETNNSTHAFEEDFITKSWSNKAKKKLEKKNKKKDKKGKKKAAPVFFNYYIDHLIQKPDGSTMMLAEQYYVRIVTRTYTDSQGNTRTTTTYYYYYNDIIAINFDKEGNFEWKKIIKKRQVSTNDGGYYSSYFVVQNGNDVNIIYNDREASLGEEEVTTKSKRALKRNIIGVQVTISEDGDLSKGKLFSFEDENAMRLVPKVCEDTGNGLVFLFAKGKRGNMLGTLKVD